MPVWVGYRVGQHVIDIVVGEGGAAVAVECGPHRDGVEPHLDRAMLLQRTVDADKSKWDSNPGQFAIELTSEFPQPSELVLVRRAHEAEPLAAYRGALSTLAS